MIEKIMVWLFGTMIMFGVIVGTLTTVKDLIWRSETKQIIEQTAELHARLDTIESKLEARDNAEFTEVMAIIGGQVELWRMDSEALNKYFEPYRRGR
jgi:prephenate dehydrogenase